MIKSATKKAGGSAKAQKSSAYIQAVWLKPGRTSFPRVLYERNVQMSRGYSVKSNKRIIIIYSGFKQIYSNFKQNLIDR